MDIIKDRQYTCQPESVARRSCQTAMYHIAHALVRWLAPILSFTAEEMWHYLPGTQETSVFLSQWYDDLEKYTSHDFDQAYWQLLNKVRAAVNKELEARRKQGLIGSSLAADVVLYGHTELQQQLNRMGEELRFVLMTSSAQVCDLQDKPDDAVASDLAGLFLTVKSSPYQKCERCWHHCQEVGENPQHPSLCARCIDNISGHGETRYYA